MRRLVAFARREGVVLVILLASASSVLGQAPGSPGVVLRAADAGCTREESTGQPERPTIVLPRAEADLSCAATPMEALEWLDARDAVFVDTRLPTDYATFGLRGAVNLSLDDLPSKSFLKSKRVVIFGSGKGDQSLYRSCARLKREGFSRVHVIRGGLMLWQLTQQPVIGRPPHPYGLARLDPAEFWLEGQFDDNVVMHVPEQKEVDAHVPFAVQVPRASADALKEVLQRRSRELKGAPMAAVVLATATDVAAAQWEQIQQSLWPIPVLHYAEGVQALSAFKARQTAAWDAMARGPKKPRCGS